MTGAAQRRALCVVHHASDDVGQVGALLRRRGYALLVRKPLDGDALPAPESVDAAVIFGGAMSANDDHLTGVRAELDWIAAALRAETPVLGLCLGGQMLARVLGARVAPRRDGLWEIGYRPLTPTRIGRRVLPPRPMFYQWHGEGFAVPASAALLATGRAFSNQAFRYGPSAYGLQFHPEISRTQLARWHVKFARDMKRPGGDAIRRQREDDVRYRPQVARWLDGFLDAWLAGGVRSSS